MRVLPPVGGPGDRRPRVKDTSLLDSPPTDRRQRERRAVRPAWTEPDHQTSQPLGARSPKCDCLPILLTTANSCTTILAWKERSHDHAESRARNQPARKGAQGAPSPRGLSHNCPTSVPELSQTCSTSAPHLYHEIEPSATRWDKMEQFGTVFDKTAGRGPSDAIALGRGP